MIDEDTKLRLVRLPKWVGETINRYEHDLALLRALTNLDMTKPCPLEIPKNAYKNPIQGYEMNVYSGQVWYGWTTDSRHGTGKYDDTKAYQGSSQGPAQLYATEVEAWRALRAEKVRKFAEELLAIDVKIMNIKLQQELAR